VFIELYDILKVFKSDSCYENILRLLFSPVLNFINKHAYDGMSINKNPCAISACIILSDLIIHIDPSDTNEDGKGEFMKLWSNLFNQLLLVLNVSSIYDINYL
jgi:hypothetical protein